MPSPVYLFTGFLDSGKTTLIKETLCDENFMADVERTLIICLEQGEEEYDQEFLDAHSTFVEYLDSADELTVERMKELDTIYHPSQVFIEYNGSEAVTDTILSGMPDYWPLVEILTTVDATTFTNYIANMRSLLFEQMRYSDVIICNRCTPDTNASFFRGNIKAINKRGQIFYEGAYGEPAELKSGILPFDKSSTLLDIPNDDYGLWYMDAVDNPDDYEGKSIILRGKYVEPLPGYDNSFVMGRRAMVCCEQDTSLCGITVTGVRVKELVRDNWYQVEGVLKTVPLTNGGKTLVIYAKAIKALPSPKNPNDEYVTFS